MIRILVLAALALAGPAPEPITISGTAVVIDGDTIVVGRAHIRLFGIDSPELAQRCLDLNRRSYQCGELAADVLQEEIAGSVVVCFPVDTDKYRRIVAVCTARDMDLGRRMVERGFARDYEFFSGGRYREAEEEARGARRGLWAGEWQEPRVWRQEHR